MKKKLKIIFAGTPEFAVTALQSLISSGHHIVAVYTQPDRPAGRGRKLQASAVKILAQQHQLPVYQPVSLKPLAAQQELAALQADVMVVAAYGLLLPKAVLEIPLHGCINIHPSLLPRWRGAAPIQRPILAGDTTTGVTIMQMDEGLDTGPMLEKIAIPLPEKITTQQLQVTLAQLGGEALLRVLEKLVNNDLQPERQNNDDAVYAKKISKEEGLIDFAQSAAHIDRQIRAFNPWPIAYTTLDQQVVRVWQATVIPAAKSGVLGEIMQVTTEGIDVATAENHLRLQQVQLPGGRAMSVAEILNSKRNLFTPGKIFGISS